MKLYNVKGYDAPRLLSEEHAELIGATEVEATDRPAKSASRAEWADYAVSRGTAPELLEGQTRAQLIETYGEV